MNEKISLVAPSILRDRLQDGSEGPEMVFIRGGTFLMGSPPDEEGRNSDERQHEVTVGDIWIGRYAVTFDEFDRTGRDLPSDLGWGRGRRPVINVSWHDAAAYAEWLSQQTGQQYRLPTEAEWEYAARAGTTTARYWGEGIGRNQARYMLADIIEQLNWSRWEKKENRQTVPVGSFAPNPWGLYDMLGNVNEWTCSVYSENYGGAEQRCDARGELRAVRGGSWDSSPARVRSASRLWNTPGYSYLTQGFRLARSP